MDPHGIRALVEGRVQGVGFRAYVRNLASRHGVDGEVWNRRDRSVELVAFHEDREVPDAFAKELAEGPGRVDAVRLEPTPGPPEAIGFHIGPTR